MRKWFQEAGGDSPTLGGTRMAVKYKEVVCHKCNGTCEVEVEPGEYGYLAVYDDCWVCEGKGFIKLHPDATYDPDKM